MHNATKLIYNVKRHSEIFIEKENLDQALLKEKMKTTHSIIDRS